MSTKKQPVKSLSDDINLDDRAQLSNGNEISPSYKGYPPEDDIYNRDKQEQDINPENINLKKVPNERSDKPNEGDFSDDYVGDDLDVPGAELDDADEKIGSEDEENNYYSIGGDNHNDLDEDHID
jgi:hypothetical protein